MKLEEAISRVKNLEVYNCDDGQAIETVLEALEKLQQDNYKLDRENQQLFESQINSIPKKKIEDMIKAYNKLIDDISESEHSSHEIPLYRHDIQVLQQLLEE